MFFFVLNMHASHERKTRQNNEEVGDDTQQGFLPTPLPMLPALSPYILRRVDSEKRKLKFSPITTLTRV